MMDNLLYSVAYVFEMQFLTLDETFVQFLVKKKLPDITISVNEIHSNNEIPF